MAGIIKYLAPIDNASGKIFGKKERFTSVTRTSGNKIRNCRMDGKRVLARTPYSPEEIAQHTFFGTIAQKANARRSKKSANYATDLAAWRKYLKDNSLTAEQYSFQKYLWQDEMSK